MKSLSLTATSLAILVSLAGASHAQNYNNDQARNMGYQYTNQADGGSGPGQFQAGGDQGLAQQGPSQQGPSQQGFGNQGFGGGTTGQGFGQQGFGQGGFGQGYYTGGGSNFADQLVINQVRQLQNIEQNLQANINSLEYNVAEGNPLRARNDQNNIGMNEQTIRQLNQRLDQQVQYASPSVQRDIAIIRGSQQYVRNGYRQLNRDTSNLNYTGMAYDNATLERAWNNLAQDEQRLQRNAMYGGGSPYETANRYTAPAGSGFSGGVLSVVPRRGAIMRR